MSRQPILSEEQIEQFKRDGFREHQDVQAGWDAFADLHITAMIAIDETNEANGSFV